MVLSIKYSVWVVNAGANWIMGSYKASTCSVAELKRAVEVGESCQIVDVREFSEYSAEHMKPSVSLPLSNLRNQVEKISKSEKTYILCKSGKRAAMAADLLADSGFRNLYVVSGGITAWRTAGYPVSESAKSIWPIERQVKLVAGVLVAGGSFLALAGNSGGLALTALVGLGLIFVAISDSCLLGFFLMQMPWNRKKSEF